MSQFVRIALIGCCLFQAGCRKAAVDEITVKQRTTALLPRLDVKLRLGDIERGKLANLEIIGPDGSSLAKKVGAQVGDRIRFSHQGKQYHVEVLHYRDDIGSDFGRFRLISAKGEGQTPAEKGGDQTAKPER